MPSTKAILLIACTLLLAACCKEQIYRGLYEGTTTHERLQNPPGPDNAPLSYDEYEMLRKAKDK